ncbi:hypothetical protein QAD02_007189 [Eretmocerus hayati]|uniref:Uncharacterized protein n=1 Tax=Eretmocerus hayati TaxID=131215 RepID=A0ACC2N3B4_9HYME|nr:hypothetical protein QAD02_007189 [Eretmocerus hayati]
MPADEVLLYAAMCVEGAFSAYLSCLPRAWAIHGQLPYDSADTASILLPVSYTVFQGILQKLVSDHRLGLQRASCATYSATLLMDASEGRRPLVFNLLPPVAS